MLDSKWIGFAGRLTKIRRYSATSRGRTPFLGGKKSEAIGAVPDALVDDVALVGSKERIVDRLQAWKEAAGKGHVASMLLGCQQPEALDAIAEAVL